MVNCRMTNLNRPLVRRTRGTYSVLYVGSRRARQIVIALLPGDVLEFRESGRRSRWQIPIDSAFRYAVHCQALASRSARRRRRNK